MYREHGQWWSPSLGKNMDFLWFGKFGRPVLLFPTSAGRFYENEDFHLTDSVADKVDAGEIQLVLIDAVNEESWYNKSVHPAVRAARHVQYDAYLRHELTPYIFNRAQRGDLGPDRTQAQHPPPLPRRIPASGRCDRLRTTCCVPDAGRRVKKIGLPGSVLQRAHGGR